MFTAELLEGWLKVCAFGSADFESVKPWLPSIAKLLNAYGSNALSVSDEDSVKYMLEQLGYTLKTSKYPWSAAQLKQKIVELLVANGIRAPASINAFSLDAPNNTLSASELEKSPDLHQILAPGERPEIAALRSDTTKANGKKLAEAAIELKHKICWLPRGQEAFLGIGISAAGKGVNHFALWLHSNELVLNARMNCWESVFYTACKANLISQSKLRILFDLASISGQRKFGEANRLALALNKPSETSSAYTEYINTMFRHLKGDKAVEFKRKEDTLKKGDLLFFNGMGHVCICVGKQQAPSGEAVPCVMSLWEQDGQRYTLLPFAELLTGRTDAISIHPCPF